MDFLGNGEREKDELMMILYYFVPFISVFLLAGYGMRDLWEFVKVNCKVTGVLAQKLMVWGSELEQNVKHRCQHRCWAPGDLERSSKMKDA